jgi:starch synthase
VFACQDNNGSQDYKIKVGLPAGLTVEAWAEQTAEELRTREYERRLTEIATAEAKAKRSEEKKKTAQVGTEEANGGGEREGESA